MTFQPCFFEVEMKERMVAKSAAPSWQRKPPEIFILTFIMRFVTLTSTGYGDIVPLHPFARGLANVCIENAGRCLYARVRGGGAEGARI
jgi:hypothetical protein